jgi:hypothetical protein
LTCRCSATSTACAASTSNAISAPDTISLARLRATMTRLDFSGPALEMTRHLAKWTAADATFNESEVDKALDVLPAGQPWDCLDSNGATEISSI